MESWKRRLRMGMIGGGPGAFIGAVHRLCAALDGQIELVAGCFSQHPEKTRQTGEQLYLAPGSRGPTAGRSADRLRQYRNAQRFTLSHRGDISECRLSCGV